MKKFFRSAIAIILAISMMPLCFAIEPEPQGGIEWAALPDNTVVCYLYGLPVYKTQIAITSWTPRGKNLGHGWSRRIYP